MTRDITALRKQVRDLSDDEFMQLVQDRTGHPWYNGQAYAGYHGLVKRPMVLKKKEAE